MEISDNPAILSTKLQKPDLPDDYINRNELIDFAGRNINRPLILVSAAAGFGKSSFVSGWIDDIPYESCWLSVDEHDNDLRTFLRYFISAVQTRFPDFGENISRSVFSPDVIPSEYIINNLVNDLNSLSDDIVLVLDDFHNISSRDILELLGRLLKYPPGKLHLVIITRTDPALPLSQFRASNSMADIRSKHLRFSKDEMKSFLEHHFEPKDMKRTVNLLDDRFEGWITGIRLLLLHLSFKGYDLKSIDEYIESNQYSEMYFFSEIFRNIDKTTLNFLLKTSLFDKFNTDLADYILSSEQKDRDSRRIIFRLMEMNFFLVNLDSGNEWFRYHHLFQAALQEELERVCGRDEISDIHRKAVEWFLGRNSFEDAFSHVLKYGNTDVVVEFVRNNMYKPLNENKWYVLEKWLKYIPEENIRGCPVLLTGRMWIMQHKGLFQAISGILKEIEQLKEEKRRLYDEVKPEIAFFDGVINFWNNDLSASLDDFNYVRGTTVPDKLAVRSLSYIYHATASRMTGSGDAVFAEIQQMVSRENLHPAFSMILLGSLEYIKLLESDLYAAERIAERLGTLGNRTGNKFYIVWYEYFMAYIAFQQYRTDDAVGYFITSLKSVYLLNTHAPVDAFAGALLSLQISGRKKEYTEVYNKLISFIHEWNNPAHTSIAYSLMARLAVNENNLKEAEDNIRKTDESFESANAVFNIEVPGITRCRVLLARNIPEKTEEALGRLETLKEMFSRTYNTPQLIEVSVLLAAGYKRSGETQKAVDSLNQALSLADKGYYIRPFFEILHEIKELFPYLENGSGILSALKSHGDFPEKNPGLSNRELDVLFLLAERKSNKEIAEELYISPATVKKHSLAIYRKLGVKKRQEAVSAGREAGILQ